MIICVSTIILYSDNESNFLSTDDICNVCRNISKFAVQTQKSDRGIAARH